MSPAMALREALNSAMVLFHDKPSVVRAVREFADKSKQHSSPSTPELLRIFRSICKSLGIPDQSITDGDWQTAFNVRDAPAAVELNVGHGMAGPYPQVVVLAHAQPNRPPVAVAVLDITRAQTLIAELQANISKAEAAATGG